MGGATPPIQVIPDRGDGLPLVTVWGARPEIESDERARELEETKRLLYVAVTRARDGLYLGIVRRDKRLSPGRGSLAEVLPKSFIAKIDAITGTSRWVEWSPSDLSSARHRFRLCYSNDSSRFAPAEPPVASLEQPAPDDDFTAWPC